MASLFAPLPKAVRLLDAGAGTGSLTAAFISRLCDSDADVESVDATLFEIDPLIQETLLARMTDCQRLCEDRGIHFKFTIHEVDFVHEISPSLADNFFSTKPP
jgi:adenine-specific DNA-methyltransferase